MKKKNLLRLLTCAGLLFFAAALTAQETGRLPVISDQANTQQRKAGDVSLPSAQVVVQPVKKGVANKEATPLVSSADVLVNNNNGATGTAGFTQSETSVIAFGNNVVIGFNDAGSAVTGNHFTGWSYSSDGGATFTDGGVLPASAAGDAGDPVLARNNTTGRIYFLTLGNTNSNVIQVFRSDDNAVTWQVPVNGTPGGSREDKAWIIVDNFAGAGNGNVYLLSRRFASLQGIYFFRSTDNGATYGPSGGTLIANNSGGNVQGAYLAVSTDHSLYAIWYDEGANNLKGRRSTDFGATWSAPVVIVNSLAGGTNGDLGLTGTRQGLAGFARFRTSKFPHAAINPVSGHIYVTYANDPAGADKADVSYVMSTDNGTTTGS